MLYVDNELNSSNVTIYFPDTQQFIGVPAFTTGYYPVLTGMYVCTVYNGTTGYAPVTAQSVTSILFCNFAIPGFLAQETLSVTVNSSSGPVIPAIGDKVATASLAITQASGGTPNDVTVLGTVSAPEQYVLTGITISASGLYVDATGTPQYITITLLDGSTIVRQITYFLTYSLTAGFTYQLLSQETDLNIPVHNLTLQTLGASPIPSTGLVKISITYAEYSL